MRRKNPYSKRTATEYIIFNHHAGNSYVQNLHFGCIEFRLDEIKIKEEKKKFVRFVFGFSSPIHSQKMWFLVWNGVRHSKITIQLILQTETKYLRILFSFSSSYIWFTIMSLLLLLPLPSLLLLLLLLFLPFIHSFILAASHFRARLMHVYAEQRNALPFVRKTIKKCNNNNNNFVRKYRVGVCVCTMHLTLCAGSSQLRAPVVVGK